MNKIEKENIDYKNFLNEVLQQIDNAKIQAASGINKVTIGLYYSIGRLIVDKQQKFGWGKSVVEKLSKDLQNITNATYSFSERNLWSMKQLYVEYNEKPELLEFVLKVPWGQNILILQKIKDGKEQAYYLQSTADFGWSRDVLLNQIKGSAYKFHLTKNKPNNFEKTLPEFLAEQADETVKSVYNLEFLGLDKPIHERKLEKLLVENIKKFLIELGYGFCFIGNQFELKGNTKDYYIDLLFYHRPLRCLVAIEIKTGEYKAEYAGKMQLYLNLLDKQIRLDDENQSIGIILCAEKDDFEVEYSIGSFDKPIGVAEYRLTKELPDNYKGKLPSPDELRNEIKKRLDIYNSDIDNDQQLDND